MLSHKRCQGVWGSLAVPDGVCSVSGNGRSSRSSRRWLLELVSVRAWLLPPSSSGSKGSTFSLFWDQLPIWERKQTDPWQEMTFFPKPCFPLALTFHWPQTGSPHGCLTQPLHPPQSPGASLPWQQTHLANIIHLVLATDNFSVPVFISIQLGSWVCLSPLRSPQVSW